MKKPSQPPRGTGGRPTVKQVGQFLKVTQKAAVQRAKNVQNAINKSGAPGLKVIIPQKGANK